MWDLIVSVPDLCLSFYFGLKQVSCMTANAKFGTNLVIMAITVIKIHCECLL